MVEDAATDRGALEVARTTSWVKEGVLLLGGAFNFSLKDDRSGAGKVLPRSQISTSFLIFSCRAIMRKSGSFTQGSAGLQSFRNVQHARK